MENNKSWREKILESRVSGQTQANWCNGHGIKLSTLRYWILKENKENISDQSNSRIEKKQSIIV